VAVEGQRVDLMLTAPMADLVGFERAPTSEQERASIRERVAALETGSWFIWDGRTCEQVAVEVTLPAGMLTLATTAADDRAGGAERDHHGHHDHERHREQHDHQSHAHEGHEHEGHEHVHEHMDGMVSWQYRCEAGVRLRRVDVNLFDGLPLQRIRTQTVSDRGQGAGELTPSARRLSLP
jgi:ABC-type Zn2+ transport system substrate-binding protein/surface adhesin